MRRRGRLGAGGLGGRLSRAAAAVLAAAGLAFALAGCGQEAERRPQPVRGERAEAAVAEYEEAVRARPADALARAELGRAYLLVHRYDEAIASLSEAIRLRPDLARAHADLGTAYGFKKQWRLAVASLEKALRLEPESIDTHSRLGMTYLAVGNLDGAWGEHEWLEARAPAQAKELLSAIQVLEARKGSPLGPGRR